MKRNEHGSFLIAGSKAFCLTDKCCLNKENTSSYSIHTQSAPSAPVNIIAIGH